MCGGKLLLWVRRTLGTEDRTRSFPLCRYPHPPLWAKSPHAPLVCCCWQGARLIMCSLLQPKRERERVREREWEGNSRLPPQACRLPRPQHHTNESRGSGWHTLGARDYCPGPERRQRERETPEADLYSCSHLNMTLFCLADLLARGGISARGHTCMSYFICMSAMHNVSLLLWFLQSFTWTPARLGTFTVSNPALTFGSLT